MNRNINKFDFIGFGALNVDTFYTLLPDKNIEELLPDLRPGGEKNWNRI